MRIVHVVEDLSAANTGVTSSVKELARIAAAHGHDVEIVATHTDELSAIPGVRVHSVPAMPLLRAWRYSWQFSQALVKAVGSGAIVHVHGVWMYPQWRAATLALSCHWPVVLSPHNMLGGWLWRRGLNRRAKKRLYFETLLRRPFSKVTIHALSRVELATLGSDFFPHSPIVHIPNALDLDSIDSSPALDEGAQSPAAPYALFLGRLHPVKGIPLLIDAFSALGPELSHAKLVIAGPPHSRRYESFLRDRVRSLGASGRIVFTGSVYGEEKRRLIAGARVLCAPSYSEGLSIVALEAMASKLPIITTPAAGLDDLEAGGGLLALPEVKSLVDALRRAFAWTSEERAARGLSARRLVERKYSWPAVWPKYEFLYASLLEVSSSAAAYEPRARPGD